MAGVLVVRLILAMLLGKTGLVLGQTGADIMLMSTATRMDALLCGALCAVAVRDQAHHGFIGKLIPWCAALAVAGMTYIFEGPPHEITTRAVYTQTFGFTLLAIGYAALVLAAYRSHRTGGLLERGLSFAPLRVFGKYSYGIYVYHVFVLMIAAASLRKYGWYARDPIPSAIFCAGVIGASLLVAVASYELFERLFLRLKGRVYTPMPGLGEMYLQPPEEHATISAGQASVSFR
jgi:peptidoglycan/LPS O-acetylase OafA/YrhL